MAKTYYRPLGLCDGPDAEQLIAGHRGGRLGGSVALAFIAVERVTRGGNEVSSDIVPYADIRTSDAIRPTDTNR